MIDKKEKEKLDRLSDEELMACLAILYGTKIPQWEKCSKEEYEKYYGKKCDSLTEILEKYLLSPNTYKCVPYWNNGGGILDQISGREPDGYNYYKLKGYEKIILLGQDLMEYVQSRNIKIE